MQVGVYAACLSAFLFFGYDQGVFGGILRKLSCSMSCSGVDTEPGVKKTRTSSNSSGTQHLLSPASLSAATVLGPCLGAS